MPERRDLAKIHIAKKELGLDESAYRAILRERYHCDSAADLDSAQAADLVEHFRNKGWRPASFAQRGLIHVLWHKLEASGAVRHPSEQALRSFVAHATGKDELRRLTVHEASRVIERLKRWLERAGDEDRRQ
ncbi:regulatory protein GemA [Geoalkalibacter halelectricus]|uniref:Regulatory protein GemA n=1 Tax=Geoalkalibacter halelectricus TaxID=2847045 RepID=A0ABY5ZQL6_9BACT|nr:regulatory protein GemA [Geoalkalibacter halelectricus]UWZ81418.1 regulatory protein GemA [Geoalkalibacter halelectricus]